MSDFSSFGATGRFGASGGGSFTPSTSGRSTSSFHYPSPLFDVSQTRVPTNIKGLFGYCEFYTQMTPIISTIVRKFSAYSLTQLVIEDASPKGFDTHRAAWERLFSQELDVMGRMEEAGLDHYSYGNAFLSIKFPFVKFLVCPRCGASHHIKSLQYKKTWWYQDYDYHLACGSCSWKGAAVVHDVPVRQPRGMRLVRWSPHLVDIDHNPVTGESEYQYTIPQGLRQKITDGHEHTLRTIPHEFVVAVKKRVRVVLDPDNLFHFKAPTLSNKDNDESWGFPPILSSLKHAFLLQVASKAQEAVLLEHMLPLDVIYPETTAALASPFENLNLSSWKARVEEELNKWRRDPNYKPVMPIPIGVRRIGGDGRMLLLTGEIKQMAEQVIIGADVPQEFVYGGLTWTGSNVSLRMLENKFLTWRDKLTRFLQFFLIPRVAAFLRWPEIRSHMRAFKMADDLQNKQLLSQLSQMQKVSDTTLLAEFNLDAGNEAEVIRQETSRKTKFQEDQILLQTAMQQKQQLASLRGQRELQEVQAKQSSPPAYGKVDVRDLVGAYAERLAGMAPDERAKRMAAMQQQGPEMASAVQAQMANPSIPPNPELRAPQRRFNAAI